jgi:HEPN domain-containing protein
MSEPEAASASRALAGEWLAKAQQDLEVAELIPGSDAARWAACFHTQQAAEEAIKAVLVDRGIDFPRSHSLTRLGELLGTEAGDFERPMLVALDPWAVAGRYPEDIPEPTRDETSRLVAGARAVVAAAGSKVGNSPGAEEDAVGEKGSATT